MDVAAEVGLAEIGVVVGVGFDGLGEVSESVGFGGAEFFAQGFVVMTSAECPDGVDEREAGEFVSRGAEIPDFVLVRGS